MGISIFIVVTNVAEGRANLHLADREYRRNEHSNREALRVATMFYTCERTLHACVPILRGTVYATALAYCTPINTVTSCRC